MTAQSTERPSRRIPADVKLYARQLVTEQAGAAAEATHAVERATHYGIAAGVAHAAKLTDAADLLALVSGFRGEALRGFREGVRTGEAGVEHLCRFASR